MLKGLGLIIIQSQGRTPQHPFRGMNELTAANGEICVEFISGSNLRPACSVNKTAKIPRLCPALHINQQNGGGDGAILTRREWTRADVASASGGQ